MRGGTHMLTHVHLFVLPTVNRPFKLNIYTVLYCPPFCSVVLFMPPPHPPICLGGGGKDFVDTIIATNALERDKR
jgi:hypothetical protein